MKCHLVILAVLLCTAAVVQCTAPTFLDDAADKVDAGFKKTTRRGVTNIDITKIEVVWQPFAMVEDKKSIDKKKLFLEVKVGDGSWNRLDKPASRRGGGKYRWTLDNDLPCKDHSLKFVVVSLDGEEAEFEYPTPIAAASTEDIANSGNFIPATPSNLKVEINENEMVASWDPVECATSYEVKYKKFTEEDDQFIYKDSETNSLILEDGIDTCSDYEIIVTAVVGTDIVSEETFSEFHTPPGTDAAQKLDPTIEPGLDSVKIKWEAWEKLSCVSDYTVTLCKDGEDCGEPVNVILDETLATAEYTHDQLDQCSAYTFKLKPLFQDQDLSDITRQFNTLSPAISDVFDQLKPVTAVAGEEQMTTVSWSPVECAAGYEIFQHVNTEEGDWESIGTSETTEFSKKGVPCTLYRYGVKVTVGNDQSEIVEASEPVMTKMPGNEPYSPPNLQITPSPNGAELSWDHAECITSYRIKSCSTEEEPINCHEETIEIEDPHQHHVAQTIDNLSSCSKYNLWVYAYSNDHEYEAEITEFSTSSPPATPPEGLNVEPNVENGEANITFNPVECASGYKIYKKLDDSEKEEVMETTELEGIVSLPEPCTKFSFGVASIVDGQESETTEFIENVIPPKNGDASQPAIEIQEAGNSTVVFVLKLPEFNQKCEVESYHVKYQNLGVTDEQEKTISHGETNEGVITLEEFPGAGDNGMKIEGRVKYSGFDVWSPWIATDDPVPVKQTQEESKASNSMLVPIIIGVLVAVVVLALVVFFLVKRKKSQSKYDSENINDADESKKLKDNPIA